MSVEYSTMPLALRGANSISVITAFRGSLGSSSPKAVLHISQPSVSQQLKLLEDEFRTKLLVRLNQGVELTSEGREFFDAIRPMLAEADNLEKRFKNSSKANDTAPLIVGGSHNVSVNVLPKLLMAFKERHPSAQFILETNEISHD